MGDKPRIGVSACVLGEPVRYNGGHCRDRHVLPELALHVEFIAICPEVESGLGAPRESMRLQDSPSGPRLVGVNTGKDETSRLTFWSKARVRAMDRLALDGFILKKGSPSCGMERVRIYRAPNTRPRYDGVGIFARELMARYPGLAVEEEGRLQDAGLREHFVTRVFASQRWRSFAATRPDRSGLLAFHAHEETLLSAHDAESARSLGLLAAHAPGTPVGDACLGEYGRGFRRTLARQPTRRTPCLFRRRPETHEEEIANHPELANGGRDDEGVDKPRGRAREARGHERAEDVAHAADDECPGQRFWQATARDGGVSIGISQSPKNNPPTLQHCEQHRPVASLSTAERTRSTLALTLSRANPNGLLVLNEPTNHLDIAILQHQLLGLDIRVQECISSRILHLPLLHRKQSRSTILRRQTRQPIPWHRRAAWPSNKKTPDRLGRSTSRANELLVEAEDE